VRSPGRPKRYGSKRVRVVRHGRVVGIVSRARLIRLLAAATAQPHLPAYSDDSRIRAKLLATLVAQALVARRAGVTVTNGVVESWGPYLLEEGHVAARVAGETQS
jgi:hypothetical protein